MLELFGTPLSELPLKIFENNYVKELEKLIDIIINDNLKENKELINQIDNIIYKIFKLNQNEINFVENFYIKKEIN